MSITYHPIIQVRSLSTIATKFVYKVTMDNQFSVEGSQDLDASGEATITTTIKADLLQDKEMNCVLEGHCEADGYLDSNVITKTFAYKPITEFVAKCERGEFTEDDIGTTVQIPTQTGTIYTLRLIGVNHDDLVDGSGKAKTTWLSEEIWEEDVKFGGSWYWYKSTIRTEGLPAILNKLPIDLQNGIKLVKKETYGENTTGLTKITEDKLFLLSETEVKGYSQRANAYGSRFIEGSQYSYFIKNTSEEIVSADILKKKTLSNRECEMWALRNFYYKEFIAGYTNSYYEYSVRAVNSEGEFDEKLVGDDDDNNYYYNVKIPLAFCI